MAHVGEIILPQFDPKSKQWTVQRYLGRVFEVEGVTIELYPIRVLARTIRRVSFTVRIWERDGLFPKPMFILPYQHGQTKRWYSKVQIANVRAVWRDYNNRKMARQFLEEVWRVFYLTALTEQAREGDVR